LEDGSRRGFLDDGSIVVSSLVTKRVLSLGQTFLRPLMMLGPRAWLCLKPAPSLPYSETFHLGVVPWGMTAILHGQSVLSHVGALRQVLTVFFLVRRVSFFLVMSALVPKKQHRMSTKSYD
jgi:hypothetical protein